MTTLVTNTHLVEDYFEGTPLRYHQKSKITPQAHR